ncbi:MAG: hypothetical protein IPL69_02790 [Saprospiraceae bacterium]|nr:hypothetical protein [Candidatus Brachybacter algidus]
MSPTINWFIPFNTKPFVRLGYVFFPFPSLVLVLVADFSGHSIPASSHPSFESIYATPRYIP